MKKLLNEFKEFALKGNMLDMAINFVLQAFVLFMLIRLFHSFQKKEEPAPETTKICPYCKSEIHIDAVKCPHCASDLPLDEKKEADKK